MNLAATIEARAAAGGWQDRPALVVERQALSHREIHEGGARLASLLSSLGVRRGDAVLLALPDGAEFAWAFLGAVRLGAVAVPVNPQLPADDHRYLAADCRAAAVVCSDELVERFASPPAPEARHSPPAPEARHSPPAPEARHSRPVVPSATLASTLAGYGPHPAVPVDDGEAAYAQYTSGTTGAPRAALHRHGDPPVYVAAFAEPALRLGPADVVLSVSKMYFAYGLGNSLFFPLLTGARAVVHPGRPHPEDIVALIHRHQATVLFAVPTFYANLLRAEPAATAFASLRVAVSAGERLPPTLAERTGRLVGCPVLDSLGTTEVGQAFVGGSLGAARPGTIGRALPPYQVAVRDDDGRDRPPGEVGTLWVRGPTVLLEYLGQPDATAAAFDGDWLRTGDLACVDEDGFVSHRGRVDDMEMVGGITVAPQEIEELLSRHPSVSEVAVAAVADGLGASRLRAFVVPARGVVADDALGAELVEMGRRQLAPYKVPRSVTFVDALPRTPTGKLRRFVLRSGAGWPVPSHAG